MAGTSTESQRNEAYERLRQNIIYLQYEPGRKLALSGLCEELEIGRTPVRGALQQLQKDGLVNTVPQSGTYVTKIDMARAEEARFMREMLEREVAGECAALATRSDLDRLDQAIELQRIAIDDGAAGDFLVSDDLMHRALFDIARRSGVWEWLGRTNADLERYRLIRVSSTELDLGEVFGQHLRLRDAISRHDTTEARFLTAQHLHMMLAEAPEVMRLRPDYFA